jgi:hypothetical protein
MTFKEWLLELLKDERGGVSIKPVITLIGSLVLCISMLMQAWIPGFNPSDTLVNAIMIVTGIGMGADTMDKFSYRPKYNFEEGKEDKGSEQKIKE